MTTRRKLFLAVWGILTVLFTTNLIPSTWFFIIGIPVFLVALVLYVWKNRQPLRNLKWLSLILHYRPQIRHALYLVLVLWAYAFIQKAADVLAPPVAPHLFLSSIDVALVRLAKASVLLVLALSIYHLRLFYPPPRRPETLPAPRPVNLWVSAIGVALLLILIEKNNAFLGWERLQTLSTFRQLLCIFGGAALLAWGMAGTPRPLIPRHLWREWALVGLIMGLAFGLRAWKLEMLFQKFIDEVSFAMQMRWIGYDTHAPILIPNFLSFTSTFAALQYEVGHFVGHHLSALRWPSLIVGTLTIPATYWLCRGLFDKSSAVVVALVLASFPPHIHYSRIGMNNIAEPLFGTLALAALAHAIKTQQRGYYALAGAALGLTQYFYEAGRLLFIPLIAVWLLSGLIFWRHQIRWHGVLMMVGITLIIAAPVYITLYKVDWPFFGRYASEGRGYDDFGSKRYFEHLRFSLLSVTSLPEWVYPYFGGRMGLVHWQLLRLFFLGFLASAISFYKPSVLIAGWVFTGILGTSLVRANIATPRYVVIHPALAACIGLGLVYGYRLLTVSLLSKYPKLHLGLIGLLGLGVTVFQANYYFNEHIPRYHEQIWSDYVYAGEDALFRSQSLPPETMVYVVSDRALDYGYGREILSYLNDPATLVIVSPDAYPNLSPQEPPVAFFVESEDAPILAWIRKHYSHVEGPLYSQNPYLPRERQLLLYFVPKTSR